MSIIRSRSKFPRSCSILGKILLARSAMRKSGILAGILLMLAQRPAQAEPLAVDLELVLAADTSMSMDADERRLQIDGYIQAQQRIPIRAFLRNRGDDIAAARLGCTSLWGRNRAFSFGPRFIPSAVFFTDTNCGSACLFACRHGHCL